MKHIEPRRILGLAMFFSIALFIASLALFALANQMEIDRETLVCRYTAENMPTPPPWECTRPVVGGGGGA